MHHSAREIYAFQVLCSSLLATRPRSALIMAKTLSASPIAKHIHHQYAFDSPPLIILLFLCFCLFSSFVLLFSIFSFLYI